jgi:predicted HTH transcriptional regulator
MAKDNILKLERIEEYRENNILEVKAAQGGLPDTLWDSYSAFANTDGGCILLGVKERDDHLLYVAGLKDAEKMKKDFWNLVNNRQKVSVNLMTENRVRIESVDGKDIIVLEVPRAERTSRPVYKGLDPRKGTYRRNGEGDYLCSLEEVSAMFRDAALSTQDAKVLQQMDMTVFCDETINSYRQVFRLTHPNHTWNRLEDEIFMRRIGAMAVGEDGIYHPTAAGLLMFGYEFEILREFPLYFLDYQENRQMATTRWTDRIVSSSGEWSGNIFDFVYKVVPKLTADLKVPFVMRGMQRVDDTPVHKILREAVTNACAHADFYGRRGLVISKTHDGFTFANPGSMRVAKKEAIEGGVSDPRNGVILKIFSLINYGERAGSGLNSIFNVWNHVYHTPATIREEVGVDRVIVTLPNGGHEQDVKAMLELYDNPDELTFPDEKVSENVEINDNDGNKLATKNKAGVKLAIKRMIVAKLAINNKNGDKLVENDNIIDKMADIVIYLDLHPNSTSSAIAKLIDLQISSARNYLTRLIEFGFVVNHGANKNRTYSLTQEILMFIHREDQS